MGKAGAPRDAGLSAITLQPAPVAATPKATPPAAAVAKSLAAARPAPLSDDVESGRPVASLNADAPEFIPMSSPVAAKQPRTPVSLAMTIAEPQDLASPPPHSPMLAALRG